MVSFSCQPAPPPDTAAEGCVCCGSTDPRLRHAAAAAARVALLLTRAAVEAAEGHAAAALSTLGAALGAAEAAPHAVRGRRESHPEVTSRHQRIPQCTYLNSSAPN
jgi:hypothetical protein